MPDSKTAPPYKVLDSNPSAPQAGEEHLQYGIQSYFFVLWKRKWLIALSLIFSMATAILINATQKPVFRATTEVVLQPKESDTSSNTSNSGNVIMQDPTFLLTQIRVIKGPQLAEKILQRYQIGEDQRVLADSFAIRGV